MRSGTVSSGAVGSVVWLAVMAAACGWDAYHAQAGTIALAFLGFMGWLWWEHPGSSSKPKV